MKGISNHTQHSMGVREEMHRVLPSQTLPSQILPPQINPALPICDFSGYTAQLLPLRDRDLRTLVDLFTSDEIDAIEADIHHNLTRLLPEPCWEDDPFDFLKEYL